MLPQESCRARPCGLWQTGEHIKFPSSCAAGRDLLVNTSLGLPSSSSSNCLVPNLLAVAGLKSALAGAQNLLLLCFSKPSLLTEDPPSRCLIRLHILFDTLATVSGPWHRTWSCSLRLRARAGRRARALSVATARTSGGFGLTVNLQHPLFT